MPPPTPLTIASSSLRRLIRDEASYHSELAIQERSIARRVNEVAAAGAGGGGDDDDDNRAVERGNAEFLLRQEVSIWVYLSLL
jgi:tubulin-specific chaperone A